MALSAGDDAELSLIGKALVLNVVRMSLALPLYGIYLAIFPISIVVLCRKLSKSRATRCLLILTTVLFLISTIRVASGIANLVQQMRLYLVDPEELLGAARRESVGAHATRLITLDFVCQSINIIIADAIVIWRAHALFPNSRILRTVMKVIVFFNTVLQFCFLVVGALQSDSFDKAVIDVHAYNSLKYLSMFLSFCTNLLATTLIGSRFWTLRKDVNCIDLQDRSQMLNILLLLGETGLVLTIFQLLNAVTTIVSDSSEMSSTIGTAAICIKELTNMFAVIFPTLIIIIVGREKASVTERNPPAIVTYPTLGMAGKGSRPSPTRFVSFHSSVRDSVHSMESGRSQFGVVDSKEEVTV